MGRLCGDYVQDEIERLIMNQVMEANAWIDDEADEYARSYEEKVDDRFNSVSNETTEIRKEISKMTKDMKKLRTENKKLKEEIEEIRKEISKQHEEESDDGRFLVNPEMTEFENTMVMMLMSMAKI